MAELIKATGTLLSAFSGTQYVPFDAEVFNNASSVFSLTGTSAITTVSAGPMKVDASVKVELEEYTAASELVLEVRQNGTKTTSAGFGEIASIDVSEKQGGNIFNRNKITYNRVKSVTLAGSTVVSAEANDEIGLYLVGPVKSKTITASIVVENKN